MIRRGVGGGGGGGRLHSVRCVLQFDRSDFKKNLKKLGVEMTMRHMRISTDIQQAVHIL